MDNGNQQQKMTELNIRIISIYLLIAASILYLIIYYKEKAKTVDTLEGTNTQSQYPDTTNYPKIIAILFIIVNSVFLYYSYESLIANGDIKNKKENDPLSNPYLLNFDANVLFFVSSLIALYNVFVNESTSITISR